MVLYKNLAVFWTFFFRQYSPVNCVLRYSSSKEPLFSAIKTRSSRSPKIDILPKGLTHCFGQEMAIFPTYFFRQIRAGKCLLWYSRTKKCLSRQEKQEVQKVEKLLQKWPFFQLFFLANIGQENVFYDILEWENVFLGYKNKKFRNFLKLIFLEKG